MLRRLLAPDPTQPVFLASLGTIPAGSVYSLTLEEGAASPAEAPAPAPGPAAADEGHVAAPASAPAGQAAPAAAPEAEAAPAPAAAAPQADAAPPPLRERPRRVGSRALLQSQPGDLLAAVLVVGGPDPLAMKTAAENAIKSVGGGKSGALEAAGIGDWRCTPVVPAQHDSSRKGDILLSAACMSGLLSPLGPYLLMALPA